MTFYSVDELTARLEKLDQNITLTLQEIDNNFSTCQHIITTKILPQISRFAEVSEDIWENSKLWWSFLESIDLTASNDSSSPASMEYINSKKKLFEDSKSMNNYEFISSTPPQGSKTMENYEFISSTPPQGSKTMENYEFISSPPLQNPPPSSKMMNNYDSISSIPLPNPPQDSKIMENYDSISSTPLPNPPQYSHKAMQSLNFGDNNSLATSSTSITLPTLPPSDIQKLRKPTIFSPPVTIQFSMPPSRLLKSPAKQAARIIVNDLLSMMSPISSIASFGEMKMLSGNLKELSLEKDDGSDDESMDSPCPSGPILASRNLFELFYDHRTEKCEREE
ncbi:4622_t:CDS:2 [Diversispora eburnea]|uniref:DASH complex subunit ASK1 n=1 Tax=Diversispora eburnea TaxID=1213867 RepID=A0A9N9ADZ3_9GLOM|nr:4622_t:CDS:2 [Diversispora eburnea]